MGDRCHLQVRTLNAHAHLFEELGMLVESEDEPHEVELVDAVDLDRATADGQPLRPCSEEGNDDARPDDRRCRVRPGAP